MKKLIALLLAMAMVFALAACTDTNNNPTDPTKGTDATTSTDAPNNPTDNTDGTEAPTDGNDDKTEGVMTYAEYAAAAIDDPVVVECYVQAHQSWWDNKIVVYAQDQDGAYFLYNMACSEEDAAKLVPGTKIRVTGYKGEYAGEIEIVDATFEILEGSWIAEPTDVTDLLASEDLINYQNLLASIKGATVVASQDGDGNDVAFLYKWNGSGTAGDDLYFNIEVGGNVYNMCVESYLTGDGTDVYEAVEALSIGDVIDLTGFLYWYNGVNPHVIDVKVAGDEKGEGVMTYAEYAAAAIDDPVVVECYVQAHQSWWDNKIVVYAQDHDGAYFLYNMACSEEDAAKLVPGTKIRVTGYKGEYAGEIEIVDATFEILEGSWIAEPTDVTDLLASEDLINYQNLLASIKGATVVASQDGDGNDVAFLYKWNGSGTAGDDLYFNIEVGGNVYNMCVESYLTGDGTDVYEAVEALNIGDVIDLTGFLYWYNGVNPHIISVTVSE